MNQQGETLLFPLLEAESSATSEGIRQQGHTFRAKTGTWYRVEHIYNQEGTGATPSSQVIKERSEIRLHVWAHRCGDSAWRSWRLASVFLNGIGRESSNQERRGSGRLRVDRKGLNLALKGTKVIGERNSEIVLSGSHENLGGNQSG